MKFFLLGFLLLPKAYASKWGIVEMVCERMKYQDCSLVKAIITVESSGNPLSVGHDGTGSLGLMQVKCDTAKFLDKINRRKEILCKNLFIPTVNVKYGIEYLNYLQKRLTKEPTITELLSAYNGGYKYQRTTKSYGIKLCNAISRAKKRACKAGEPFNIEYSRKVIQAYNQIRSDVWNTEKK